MARASNTGVYVQITDNDAGRVRYAYRVQHITPYLGKSMKTNVYYSPILPPTTLLKSYSPYVLYSLNSRYGTTMPHTAPRYKAYVTLTRAHHTHPNSPDHLPHDGRKASTAWSQSSAATPGRSGNHISSNKAAATHPPQHHYSPS